MKKSLSRVLSLALALVMLLGAMPFALADTPAHEHKFEDQGTEAEGYVAPTCTEPGKMPQKCSVEGCEVTQVVDIDALGHDVKNPTPVKGKEPTCMKKGEGTGICETCKQNVTVEMAIDPDAHHFENGACINTDEDGKVCGVVDPAASAYTVKISGEKTLYLNEKDLDTVQLKAELFKSGSTDPMPATFEWFSNEYVNVDSTGKVTARKPGKASVFVSATYKAADGKETTVKSENVEFNVVENVIECKAGEVPYSTTASFQLDPKIEGVPTASFTYKIVSEYNYGNVTAGGKVTPDKTPGVARVEITASWTDHTVTKVVPVSFYEEVDVTATVKTGVSSFLFGDSDVFSSVAFDNKSESKPSAFAMRDLYKSDYTNDWTYVNLKQADPSSTVASITYPGSSTTFNGFNPNSSNMYEAATALRLKFTCLKKGTFKLDYSLATTEGLLVRYGTITINTQEGAANIKYKTSYTNSVTINEKDFAQYWKDSKMTTELDYVKFGVSNVIPYYGELYTTNSATTRKEVTASMSFDYNATSKDTYDLDLVTFVPSASKKTSYTEEIPFTCYGSKSETLSGVMVIEVTGDLPFKDVKTTDWFYEDVAYVYNNDIMNGTAADKFEPNSTLTRAMVVTMLYRIEGEPSVSYSGTFKDVTKNQWYTEAVEWAAKNDIVKGFDANTFGPSRAITREQLAAILYRYANYKKLDTSHSSSLSKFADSDKVSSYAKDALEWAVYEGIMNGEAGNLKPTGTATRAQAAAMFHRFLED